MALAMDGVVDSGGINHVYTPSSSGFGYYGYGTSDRPKSLILVSRRFSYLGATQLTTVIAGKFTPSTLTTIRSAPEVDYVERDQIIRTQDVRTGVDDWSSTAPQGDLEASANETVPQIVTELGAPWGLARISHRSPLHLSTFTRYVYDHDGGEGVTAYVIDTGINVNHVEFEGRAIWGKTIPKNDVDQDENGHGTHCAGTVASRKYGIAKAAKVVAVKVLGSNGSGSMSDVVAGVV
jgi:cerevisin